MSHLCICCEWSEEFSICRKFEPGLSVTQSCKKFSDPKLFVVDKVTGIYQLKWIFWKLLYCLLGMNVTLNFSRICNMTFDMIDYTGSIMAQVLDAGEVLTTESKATISRFLNCKNWWPRLCWGWNIRLLTIFSPLLM